jgi:N-acetylglucosaminyl-diphospho-decaprenol L-rhamnosyltransferase
MTARPGPGAEELSVVVVVSFEPAESVLRCVQSALDSAGDIRLEVVLVDNASPQDVAGAVRQSLPEVRVIRNQSNLGFPSAANRGIAGTDSEFVFLLNPDAAVTAGTLAGLVKVARDHPRAGAIGVMVRNPDGTIYPSARRFPSLTQGLVHTLIGPIWPENPASRAYRMAGWDRETERRVDWVSGSSMLLRRAAVDEVGPFDEGFFMYVEDMDLCTRLRAARWEVWFSPEMEIDHVGGIATAGKRRMTLEHSRSIYRYFVKHRSTGWRVVLRPLAWLALRLRAAVVSWRRHER